MEKVIILLSTYNGDKYLKEQLDSLLSQSYENIKIIIRDDGSFDDTTKILFKYQKMFPNRIKVIFQKNIGVLKSFFDLILNSEKADYYFFCDQDDIWEKNKVMSAVKQIKKYENYKTYVGYCSNLKLVDENLNYMGMCYKNKIKPSLENCLFENVVAGCTFACNKNLFLKMRSDIKNLNISDIIMHDYYFYFVTMIYGKLIIDNNSYILYRQHSNNTIGGSNTFLRKFIKRGKFFKKNKNKKFKMFQTLLKYYNFLETDQSFKVITEYDNFFKRLKNIFLLRIKRQNKIDTLLMSFLYLIKYY